jgi:hypothetical protein
MLKKLTGRVLVDVLVFIFVLLVAVAVVWIILQNVKG